MNAFSEKPELPELIVPKLWTCPLTGIVVPKTPAENLAWRAKLLAEAETDVGLQQALYTAASQSLLCFINAFCFTLRVFETIDGGEVKQARHSNIPYVTWPVQDRHLLRIEHAIENGEELLTDKSRDMGATWNHLAVLTHRFLFRERESHLVISRKEDAVDVLDGIPKNYPYGPLSDPGTLFGKIDYILMHLPEWMVPEISRKKLHVINHTTHSRIDGESSNATAGSSDRRTSIFMDEFAKIDEAEAIKRSTKDVTASRLINSTPNGPGTVFSKWRLSGTIPVFELAWWEHPEKGKDRRAEQDLLGKWKIRSPWYDRQCAERSLKEIAIEIDMDHVGSGDTFFEAHIIEGQVKKYVKPPRRHMTIKFKKSASEDDIVAASGNRKTDKLFISSASGPWNVWCPLPKDGRPDQSRSYTIGIDLSKGMGASNSVMSVMCDQTKEKIAEFADANTPPHEMAKLAVAAATWVGGIRRALIIWENNGDPGFDFGRMLVHTYRYPVVYFDRQAGTIREKSGKRYGWRSNPEKKASALGLLRRAYALGTFKNPSEAALNECLLYVYFEGGGIGPSELVAESSSARAAHGDRVIADMLCLVASVKGKDHTDASPNMPQRSFAHRFHEFKQAKKLRDKRGRVPTHFNWSAS